MTFSQLKNKTRQIYREIKTTQPLDAISPWTAMDQIIQSYGDAWWEYEQFLMEMEVLYETGIPKELYVQEGFFIIHFYNDYNIETGEAGTNQIVLVSSIGRLLIDFLFIRLYNPFILNPNP